jgi:SagB-type dehydrogenase family enzyme
VKVEPGPRAIQRPAMCGLVTATVEALSTPRGTPPSVDFFELLEARASIMPTTPLSKAGLSKLLWCSSRCHSTWPDQNGIERQRRPYPSAGGIYETALIIADTSQPRTWCYDAVTHALRGIEPRRDSLEAFVQGVQAIGTGHQCTTLVAAVHTCALNEAYEHAESLVWRDAGALLATLHLTAMALGLNSTILGILGAELVESLPSTCGQFKAAGVLAVGEDGPKPSLRSE